MKRFTWTFPIPIYFIEIPYFRSEPLQKEDKRLPEYWPALEYSLKVSESLLTLLLIYLDFVAILNLCPIYP